MTDPTPSNHVTWRELVTQVTETLHDRAAARWLCEHASGCDGDEFREILDDLVSARSGLHLEDMVRRILAGEPLQYVMGRWAFRRLDLMVDQRVLIPRPETELLVDKVLDHVRRTVLSQRTTVIVADLGTGSGAIGLSILDELPLGSATVWMTDVSSEALDVARANAAGLGRHGAGARFAQGEWFAALPPESVGHLDVVVSNPPYIALGDPNLEESVRRWEPELALYSGRDGLDAIHVIANEARLWLAPGGLLALEIGHEQGTDAACLLRSVGYLNVEIARDLSGHDRFALGVTAS